MTQPIVMTREEHLNNPGGIEHGPDKWVGMAESQPDKELVNFMAPVYGLRAIVRNFRSYQREGITTLAKAITKWAPPDENNTAAYIKAVCDYCQFDENTPVVFDNIMPALVKAVVIHENSRCIYSDALITQAIAMAKGGVAAPAPSAPILPLPAPAAPAAPVPAAAPAPQPESQAMSEHKTMADLLYAAWSSVSQHRTKLVGAAISVLGYVSTQPDLLSPKWVSACVVASGILTILCGVANTSAIAAQKSTRSK